MGNRNSLLFFILVLMCHGVTLTMGLWRKHDDVETMFLMKNSKSVVKTDAGEMRVLESYGDAKLMERRLHIGFISMELRSLFVPQYIDSSFIIFLHEGEAKLGFMYRGKLAERTLKMGDVYRIPAGSAFYLVNIGEGQKLHIICSIDPSEAVGVGTFQSFYLGGGANPASVLSGFGTDILEAAFNVSAEEVRKMFTRQHEGPIVNLDQQDTGLWSKFLQLKDEDKLQHLKGMVLDQQEEDFDDEDNDGQEEEKQRVWSWRKLLDSVVCDELKKAWNPNKGMGKKPPHICNLYDRAPDFINSHGWSVAVDGSDYSPLKMSGVGIYHVNLSAGAMMTPHMNPMATEYGIVLRGSGRIQIVFPNGTNAMDAEIKEGDVFFIPRYFPFCQIASKDQPLEFFGFTTSASKNRPQFLVGATSLMRTMMGPELAAAFGVSEETMRHMVDAQHEDVILPYPHHQDHNKEVVEVDTIPKLIRNAMVLGWMEDHERRRKAMKRMQTSLVLREEHVHANQDFVNVKGGDDDKSHIGQI
ncbi:hypothetical protein AHAS_Ahas08G0077000 [Arachis hypogaea]